MDGTKSKHRPYFELAHGFAKQGIPTFRFNKRTYEHPKKFSGKTLTAQEEYMDDIARVAVELTFMGYQNIFLFGHGLGGNVCAYALEKDKIQGAITFGAGFRDFEDLLLYQFQTSRIRESLANNPFITRVNAAKKAKKNAPDAMGLYPLDFGPGFWWSWHNVDHRNSFRRCLKPVLITLGGQDINVPREDYINWLKSMK
ncbi:MAG: pimeloyl-ACP methyl ester carboxylesterase, partial [Luteibaculaceae bacterium]